MPKLEKTAEDLGKMRREERRLNREYERACLRLDGDEARRALEELDEKAEALRREAVDESADFIGRG